LVGKQRKSPKSEKIRPSEEKQKKVEISDKMATLIVSYKRLSFSTF
jgi:hypothetical protein